MPEAVLGAQLYTVREFTKTLDGLAETLRKIAAIGYRTIQISAIGPIDPKDVARIVQDNGLQVASTHMGWRSFTAKLDDLIHTHKLWKCSHPAIGALGAEYRSAEGLERFLDELPPVAEGLAREGMDFSYHNHSHELARIGEKTWLEALYERAGSEILKAEIDTYWIQAGGGDPAAWIRKLGRRQPLLHLKDMTIGPDRQQRFAPVGEGNLNWPAVLQAAEQVGVEYYLVEQDDSYQRNPFECLATSYRNLVAMGLR
jgi:sugar phosphate isomerase/epimerase